MVRLTAWRLNSPLRPEAGPQPENRPHLIPPSLPFMRGCRPPAPPDLFAVALAAKRRVRLALEGVLEGGKSDSEVHQVTTSCPYSRRSC